MSEPTYAVSPAVAQALDDVSLTPTARLMMWHLSKRLDLFEYRVVYGESISHEMRIKPSTASITLDLLVERGYLDESEKKKPRAFRLPWSRRTAVHRAT